MFAPRLHFGRLASLALLAGVLSANVSPGARGAEPISEQEAHAIGVDAYLYFYPLVTMDLTRRQLTNGGPAATPIQAPMNTFANIGAYPTADMKAVVRPNFDTLYSSAWLDLTKEPVIVSVPDTNGRYYLLRCSICGVTFSPRRVGAPLAPRPPTSWWLRLTGRVRYPKVSRASMRRPHMSGSSAAPRRMDWRIMILSTKFRQP